ncbi:MAG: hypothetical protein ACLQU3_20085 [Limisphaerales bacterium]
MNLSTTEIRFLSRCRKAQRQWPVWRWLILVVAITFWTASSYILLQITTSADKTSAPPAMVGFQQDVFWIMNVVCALLVMFTIVRWRGDARTSLLLKIVEEQQTRDMRIALISGAGSLIRHVMRIALARS